MKQETFLQPEVRGKLSGLRKVMLASGELSLGTWQKNDTSIYPSMYLPDEKSITYGFLEKKFYEGKLKAYTWERESQGVLHGVRTSISPSSLFFIDEYALFLDEMKEAVQTAYADNKIFFQIPQRYDNSQTLPINHAVWKLIFLLYREFRNLQEQRNVHNLIASLTRRAFPDVQRVDARVYIEKMFTYKKFQSLLPGFDDDMEVICEHYAPSPMVETAQQNDIGAKNSIPARRSPEELKELALAITEREIKTATDPKHKEILQVGLMSITGKNRGLDKIAKILNTPKSTAKWSEPRRRKYIEYMIREHDLDVTLFMPQANKKCDKSG